MASLFTAAETTKVFKIFGIPQSGSAYVAGRIISLYGPGGNTYDFSALVTALNTQLAAVNATAYIECQTQIVEWDNITDFSELTVDSDSSSKGQLVNHAKRRDRVRMTISNLIGFVCPPGGFFADSNLVQWGGNGPRVLR